jgi:hypothetical protein
VTIGHQNMTEVSRRHTCWAAYSRSFCIAAWYGADRCQPKKAALTAMIATSGWTSKRNARRSQRGGCTLGWRGSARSRSGGTAPIRIVICRRCAESR